MRVTPRHAYAPGRFTLEPCYFCKGLGHFPGWDGDPRPCDRCGATGDRPRKSPTLEEALTRWPRLLRCCSWVAILGTYEAAGALRDYIGNRAGAYRTGGGEAVSHFGGPSAVLRAALRARHSVRGLDGGRYFRTIRAPDGCPHPGTSAAACPVCNLEPAPA